MKVNEIEPKNDDPKTLIASSVFNELVRPKISFPIKLIDQNKKIAEIMSAQGCVARCTFCQRYIKGYRVYNPVDMETHIINIKEK